MTQRSHQPTNGHEESLITRLCQAMGLATQSKRAPERRLIDQSEKLESRQMLSATSSNAPDLNYNFPIAERTAPVVLQTAPIVIQPSVVDVQDQGFSVLENSGNGTIVGTVVAYDPDSLTPLSYAITAGNTNSAFAINPVTGQITVANSAALNYEAQSIFSLTVTVTDSDLAMTSDTAVVTIQLVNVDEPTSIVLDPTPTTYLIGSAPTVVDPLAVLVPDPDSPTPSYKNARLKIDIVGRPGGDVLRVLSQGNGPGQIRVTATQIYYEGRAIASYRGGRNTEPPLTISFYSAATDAAVQALLRQIAFNTKTHANPAPPRTITFALINVGGQNAPIVSRVINITRP